MRGGLKFINETQKCTYTKLFTLMKMKMRIFFVNFEIKNIFNLKIIF